MRLLFEGGSYYIGTSLRCGSNSRVALNQGPLLIETLRYLQVLSRGIDFSKNTKHFWFVAFLQIESAAAVVSVPLFMCIFLH